ncbi:related to glutamate decarboxylase [Cephalotrichum gorgonifer]|uniref:Glutamate decarboxylase n=1 Tax=Cephalotrichum gorgonifer TaxID=2041049 RepID=A0AAE8STQ1_9PEZI|nr:related to glutamate decarboxylase [Cephalotrichum gorgonifer]
MLSRHVNPDDMVSHLREVTPGLSHPGSRPSRHSTPYSSAYTSIDAFPTWRVPDEGAPSDTVYQLIHDEVNLDGKPDLNLASFVTTWMEPNAKQLMDENVNKNLADADEYPALIRVHEKCITILGNLWGTGPNEKAVGSATTGSSEAIHLGGLAMKRRWQEKMRAAGKSTEKPNIIMGADAQVALEKFANYFDVEARILPVSKKSHYRLDPELVKENIDENTIGVLVILGSTYTGHYEPVEEISKILDEYQYKTGIDIPIHVDAASGGFIAPFADAGAGVGKKWNFELPRVVSINTSGHKFGLVYVGLGWVVWRDESYLPESLVFELGYLGGTEKSFTLNFSRPGAHVLLQYYNFIHLGHNGYREVMENCLRNARLLSRALEGTGWYTVVSEIHRPLEGSKEKVKAGIAAGTTSKAVGDDEITSADFEAGLPVVAFRFSDQFKKEFPHVKQEAVSQLMRAREWIIPNYSLPRHEDKTEILRVVVRENMSFDLLEKLVGDVCSVTEGLIESADLDLSKLVVKAWGRGRRKGKAKGKGHADEADTHRGVC